MHCKETTPLWRGVAASLLLNVQSWNLVHCETLWGDGHEQHAPFQPSPCWVGKGLSCPILLFHQGQIPSFLVGFLGAQCLHGIWELVNHSEWSRVAEELLLARVQSGFCRPPRLWAQTQRSSSQHPYGHSSVPQPVLPHAWLPRWAEEAERDTSSCFPPHPYDLISVPCLWLGVLMEREGAGSGVFRHNFLNPEQQSNSDTQPPTCKVAHGSVL